jgi:GT2 family glycosyltransferase
MALTTPVSVVVPVCNGARWLPRMLEAIERECAGRRFEIIAVEDGSRDRSRRLLADAARAGRLRLVDGPRRGIAAAINTGIREARFPLIAQVDQDVEVGAGWLGTLLEALEDPDVAAAQGRYVTDPQAPFWARVMGRDLDERYRRLRPGPVDHVCTGNSVYRAYALRQVGLLDETMGYGSDNDLSYRLAAAGYRLEFCPDATSTHRWRDTAGAYLAQQYGVGYGRLDLLARHPRRAGGDDVSGTLMMAHAPVLLAAVALLAIAAAVGLAAAPAPLLLTGAASLVLLIVCERALAGLRNWYYFGDPAALAFPVVHLARDLAWAAAILVWLGRRVRGAPGDARHSMRRPPMRLSGHAAAEPTPLDRVLALVPAHNERQNLPGVIADLRRACAALDILVVDDGSSDGTADLLPRLGVRWLSLPQRVGVGGAVRTGLRYALTHGYAHVVRVDGDGQHRACDVKRLLAPVVSGRVDVAIGSRFLHRPARRLGPGRTTRAALAACLSCFTRHRVTDPTSGAWCFGPRAIRLLGRHHPTGYPEPELVLLLARNGLRIGEVPIRVRPRRAGRTSLTWPRASLALARTLLAVVVVPMRQAVGDDGGD